MKLQLQVFFLGGGRLGTLGRLLVLWRLRATLRTLPKLESGAPGYN